jgi:LysR family transcriptional regulator, transcription activator of glutamate synthase operon
MDVRQLRSFLAAARLQHFTRAAEELHIAQPALSQQIRQLEEDLGVQLFERSSRRVRLTAAGMALVERAERILLDMERIRSEMGEFAGLLRGQLAIGALPTVVERQLPALIGQFHLQHPGIELRLVEDHSEQLLALVSSGLLDLAFTHISSSHDAPLIRFPIMFPAEIVTMPLYTDDLVAIVAPQHPWTQLAAITFQMLAREPLIVFKPGSSIRALLYAAAKHYDVELHMRFEVGSTLAARSLAAAGLGVVILPRSEALAGGPPVAAVAIESPKLTGHMLMAQHRDRALSPVAQAFMQVVHQYYGLST